MASGTDSLNNSIISFSTLIAALLFVFFLVNIEGYLGVVISVVIIKTGVDVFKESISNLIGTRIDTALARNLKTFLINYKDILGAYDLTLHRYGPEKIIGSVHLEVPDSMTARQIHTLTRIIMEDGFKTYGIVLTIGIYAFNTDIPVFKAMKQKLLELAEKEKDILQIHGFYVDEKTKEVSFDLILDFESKRKKEICLHLVKQMETAYPEYHFYVILDSSFSD